MSFRWVKICGSDFHMMAKILHFRNGKKHAWYKTFLQTDMKIHWLICLSLMMDEEKVSILERELTREHNSSLSLAFILEIIREKLLRLSRKSLSLGLPPNLGFFLEKGDWKQLQPRALLGVQWFSLPSVPLGKGIHLHMPDFSLSFTGRQKQHSLQADFAQFQTWR